MVYDLGQVVNLSVKGMGILSRIGLYALRIRSTLSKDNPDYSVWTETFGITNRLAHELTSAGTEAMTRWVTRGSYGGQLPLLSEDDAITKLGRNLAAQPAALEAIGEAEDLRGLGRMEFNV